MIFTSGSCKNILFQVGCESTRNFGWSGEVIVHSQHAPLTGPKATKSTSAVCKTKLVEVLEQMKLLFLIFIDRELSTTTTSNSGSLQQDVVSRNCFLSVTFFGG